MILFVAMMVIASGMLFGYSLVSITGVLDVITGTYELTEDFAVEQFITQFAIVSVVRTFGTTRGID